MNDDFYIGWESKSPSRIGQATRRFVVVSLLGVVALAVGLAIGQKTIGVSAFEWGDLKTVSGVLQTQPYPHLLVPRPGYTAGTTAFSTYYLVNQSKFGLPQDRLAAADGHTVSVKGTLIYREAQTMLETRPEWIQPQTNVMGFAPPAMRSLGKETLAGEIVDSKCFFGVMNPGRLETHRACAIRCISGGCPPVLVVEDASGRATYFMLVSSEGKPVNDQVLDQVAQPIEITGEVQRQGDLLILRADPKDYRKL